MRIHTALLLVALTTGTTGSDVAAQVALPLESRSLHAHAPGETCIPPHVRAEMTRRSAQARARWQQRRGGNQVPENDFGKPEVCIPALTLDPFPQAGILDEDLVLTAYFDHLGTDYTCGGKTYPAHRGADSPIRTFAEQAVGVPIYAAADGIVMTVSDGNFDQQTVLDNGGDPNFVILAHPPNTPNGNATETWYYHLKAGSISVAPGQTVCAGQKIGETGSSGNSNWPHLHFEVKCITSALTGGSVDPYSGACNPTASLWASQPPYTTRPVAFDFGFSANNPMQSLTPPYSPPRIGSISSSAHSFYWWGTFANVPDGSLVTVEWFAPGGGPGILWSSTLQGNGGSTLRFLTQGISLFLHPSLPTGVWTVRITIGNHVVIDNAPLHVLTTVSPGHNAPPNDVTATLSGTERYLECRVTSDPIADDRDYDVVSYDWEWERNGVVVDSYRTAARSDIYRPAPGPSGDCSFTDNGDLWTCTVTPHDGQVPGESTTVATWISTNSPPWTDVGHAKPGSFGTATLEGYGPLTQGSSNTVRIRNGLAQAAVTLFAGPLSVPQDFMGGTLVPTPVTSQVLLTLDANGELSIPWAMPPQAPPGVEMFVQGWIVDTGASFGLAATNGLRLEVQ